MFLGWGSCADRLLLNELSLGSFVRAKFIKKWSVAFCFIIVLIKINLGQKISAQISTIFWCWNSGAFFLYHPFPTEHQPPLGQIPGAAVISSCHFSCCHLCLPTSKTLKSSICSFTLHMKIILTCTKRVPVKAVRGKEESQFLWGTINIGVVVRRDLQQEVWRCLSSVVCEMHMCKDCRMEYASAKAEKIIL